MSEAAIMQMMSEMHTDLSNMRNDMEDFKRTNIAVTQRHAEHLNQVTIQAGRALDRADEAVRVRKEMLAWMRGAGRVAMISFGVIILLLIGMIFHIPTNINLP